MEMNLSPEKRGILKDALIMTSILAGASFVGLAFHTIRFLDTNIVVIYLLSVLMTAWLTHSFIFGFISSILATFLFNYLFTPPFYAFSVNDPNYIVTFIVMTFTALITSTLTSQAQKSSLESLKKEMETKALYNLTNHLTDARDIHNISEISTKAISDCFRCNVACLCYDENNTPEQTFLEQVFCAGQIRRETGDIHMIQKQIDSLRTGFYIGDEFYEWPVYGRESILGIIRMPKGPAEKMDEAQSRLFRAMLESTALAMDRFRSAELRMKSREEIIKERYRANLLRAISHDIRTPLASIIGATEMLISITQRGDQGYIQAQSIKQDAEWLHALVENILNLTRIQDGKLEIRKQWEAVEEVVGEAVGQITKRAPDYDVSVRVPDNLFLVPMDAKLIKQVIINLLDNAILHTEPGKEIEVIVHPGRNAQTAEFIVRDRGKGIKEDDLPRIFEVFYTANSKFADAKHGIGLGLAICEAIVKAHDGNIEARNRKGGGAEFIFTLPIKGDRRES